MTQTGWLLYESDSAEANKWFIEKLQKECEPFGLSLKLVYTDYVSDAYNMNLGELADEMLGSREMPAFIVNRSRMADIAYGFEKRGIRVFNPAKVTEIANDKDLSYKLADSLGIPYMPYVTIGEDDIESLLPEEYSHCGKVTQERNDIFKGAHARYRVIPEYECVRSVSDTEGYRRIRQTAEEFGYPFVLKPAEGHGGQHVSLVESEDDLRAALQNIIVGYNKHPYRKLLLQRLSSVRGRDLRIYYIGGKMVVGMLRTANNAGEFRANFSLGGDASVYTPGLKERSFSEKLSEAVPGDYMGIDFIFDDNGAPVFNEIEDVVGARMIYANTDIDMVRLFAHRIGSVL